MVKFYRGITFGAKAARYNKEYIKWFIANLDDKYHVLFEFYPKDGTEIDILIIHETGIHNVEVKKFDWVELSQNGPCKYRDRTTKKIKVYTRGMLFSQPMRQAKPLERWLKKSYEKLSINKANKTEIKVYPYLLSPEVDPPPTLVEKHSYVRPCNGPEELMRKLRKWPNLRIDESAIKYIISEHRLREISVDDMLELANRQDWWLEGVIMREYRDKWGDVLSQKVQEEDFQHFMDRFVDLIVQQQHKGEVLEEEKPLTELRKYRIPISPLFMFPFVKNPAEKQIIDKTLAAQGIDVFERPFAAWKARWSQGKELFFDRETKRKERGIEKKSRIELKSLNNVYKELLDKQSWIIGTAGSGKSFCARRIWGLLIQDYINNETDAIPVFLDCGSRDFSKHVNQILDVCKRAEFQLEAFIRNAAKTWCHYSLPESDYAANLKLFLIIDAIDELEDLEVLISLQSFIKGNNIPVVLFCRDNFLDDVRDIIERSAFIFRIEKPDDLFRNAILTEEQLKAYGTLSFQTKQLLNLPLHLVSLSSIIENLSSDSQINE
ncbi:MAG: NERD domain-containing protein, partial [Candidatus Hodarchaeales archaeon]